MNNNINQETNVEAGIPKYKFILAFFAVIIIISFFVLHANGKLSLETENEKTTSITTSAVEYSRKEPSAEELSQFESSTDEAEDKNITTNEPNSKEEIVSKSERSTQNYRVEKKNNEIISKSRNSTTPKTDTTDNSTKTDTTTEDKKIEIHTLKGDSATAEKTSSN